MIYTSFTAVYVGCGSDITLSSLSEKWIGKEVFTALSFPLAHIQTWMTFLHFPAGFHSRFSFRITLSRDRRFLTPLPGPLLANSTRPVSIGSRYLSRCVRAATSFTVSCPCPNLSVGVPQPETRGDVSPLPSTVTNVTIFVATDDRGESNRRGRALFALFPVRCRLFAEALFPPVSVSCANTAAPLIHPVTEYALLDIKITRFFGTPSTYWLRSDVGSLRHRLLISLL